MSAVRLMWMFVLFDLPVVEKEDRKAATDFRNYLLDDGFQMVQFSTYVRLLSGKEVLPHYVNSIKANLPEKGKVDIICITDKQYENIISWKGRSKNEPKKEGKQFLLF